MEEEADPLLEIGANHAMHVVLHRRTGRSFLVALMVPLVSRALEIIVHVEHRLGRLPVTVDVLPLHKIPRGETRTMLKRRASPRVAQCLSDLLGRDFCLEKKSVLQRRFLLSERKSFSSRRSLSIRELVNLTSPTCTHSA